MGKREGRNAVALGTDHHPYAAAIGEAPPVNDRERGTETG